jgi:hypothetical protein
MALKGTLKDFGISDILQLIGQQQKTGTLVMNSKGESVTITFRDGNIVKAEAKARKGKDLIGSMLVAAGLISEQQLDAALEAQKRTLQRLGDILVGNGHITAEKFRDIVQLQASETMYHLFSWNSGSYEFEPMEVEGDPMLTPIRADSVLMEGIRRVDEWPIVRKRIKSLDMVFECVRELAPPQLAKDEFDAALDDAMGGRPSERQAGEIGVIGDNERQVYKHVQPGRNVERLIELSCLGEFETVKALNNLVNLGYLEGTVGQKRRRASRFEGDTDSSSKAWFGKVAVGAVVAGLLGFIILGVDSGSLRLGGSNARVTVDPAAERLIGRHQLSRIAAALELDRLEKGSLPKDLTELVATGLLAANDLSYPWRDPYYYRRASDTAYVLLPPLR